MVDRTVREQEIHPILIDTDQVVEHILTAGQNPSRLFTITPIPITGKVLSPDRKALGPCYVTEVFINHPPYQTVTTDADGNFEILPGVTVGVWNITSNGGGSVTVQVKDDGTVIPAKPELINESETPIQTGIVNGIYCNAEFGFSVSSPNDNWTIREPNPNDPGEADSLVILERVGQFTYVQIITQSDVPSVCDETEEMMHLLVDMMEKEIKEELGIPAIIEEEPVRRIVVSGLDGCEVVMQMKTRDPLTGLEVTIANFKFVFLQDGVDAYAFMLVTMADEKDIPGVFADFDRILDSFQISK